MDAQGGEKIDLMTVLYGSTLVENAIERNNFHGEYYYLSERVLDTFKQLQEYSPSEYFSGWGSEQAYYILEL